MAFTIDFINIYTFIYMIIIKYSQTMIELNDFPKLSNLPKAGWINSIFTFMHDDY